MGLGAQAHLQAQLCQQRAPVCSRCSEAQIFLARILGLARIFLNLPPPMLQCFTMLDSKSQDSQT